MFADFGGQQHHKQKVQTVLESANHYLSVEASKPIKMNKTIFFFKEGSPIWIFGTRKVLHQEGEVTEIFLKTVL